jgi:hypothetical protein
MQLATAATMFVTRSATQSPLAILRPLRSAVCPHYPKSGPRPVVRTNREPRPGHCQNCLTVLLLGRWAFRVTHPRSTPCTDCFDGSCHCEPRRVGVVHAPQSPFQSRTMTEVEKLRSELKRLVDSLTASGSDQSYSTLGRIERIVQELRDATNEQSGKSVAPGRLPSADSAE